MCSAVLHLSKKGKYPSQALLGDPSEVVFRPCRISLQLLGKKEPFRLASFVQILTPQKTTFPCITTRPFAMTLKMLLACWCLLFSFLTARWYCIIIYQCVWHSLEIFLQMFPDLPQSPYKVELLVSFGGMGPRIWSRREEHHF